MSFEITKNFYIQVRFINIVGAELESTSLDKLAIRLCKDMQRACLNQKEAELIAIPISAKIEEQPVAPAPAKV
jgi:hypothetical protein